MFVVSSPQLAVGELDGVTLLAEYDGLVRQAFEDLVGCLHALALEFLCRLMCHV